MIRFFLILVILAGPLWAKPMCLCAKCLTAPFSYWNLYSPHEAMAPAYTPGQCMVARRLSAEKVQRGDVVLFKENGIPFFFRLIGLPGDTVQMQGGRVVLNGEPLVQETGPDDVVTMERSDAGGMPACVNAPVAMGADCLRQRATETLPNGRSYDVLDIGDRSFDDTPVFTVPEGHVFVLGDNRDNSADSRIPAHQGGRGFIPMTDIWGIVE